MQAAAQGAGEHPPSVPIAVGKNGNILKIDGQTLTVAIPQEIKVIGDGAEQKLGSLSAGDNIRFGGDGPAPRKQKTSPKTTLGFRSAVRRDLLAGFIAVVLVLFVAGLATGRSNNGKLAFWQSAEFLCRRRRSDQQLANSMVLSSAQVLVAYLTTIFCARWMTGWDLLGGVGIPVNLLAFSGLSALSFGGARAITVSKINAASAGGTAPVCGCSGRAQRKMQQMTPRSKLPPQPAPLKLLKRQPTTLALSLQARRHRRRRGSL